MEAMFDPNLASVQAVEQGMTTKLGNAVLHTPRVNRTKLSPYTQNCAPIFRAVVRLTWAGPKLLQGTIGLSDQWLR